MGQAQAIELLISALRRDRIAPAYLFVGPPGVGRSLAARDFASLLLAPTQPPSPLLRQRVQQGNHPDVLWVEPTYLHQNKLVSAAEAADLGIKRRSPPVIRIEQIRDIAHFLGRPPLEAKRAVVVLQDAETMAESAANGLLKTLEEPGRATIILIAPSVDALLPTLVSRCQRIPFRRLGQVEMQQVLQQTGHDDILNHPEVLALAQGCPGEAIAHWQQRQAIPPEVLEATVHLPTTLHQALTLARHIDQNLDTESQMWLLDYVQHTHWQQLRHPSSLDYMETARRQLRSYANARLVWEVLLMKMLAPQASPLA